MRADAGNAAFDVILADYQRYHAVLVVLAAIFLAVVVIAVVVCIRALRRARRSPGGATRRQVWTYRFLIASGTLIGLFLLVVLAANISTVVDPERGFAGVDQSGRAFTSWLASGSAAIPADVQASIDARLAWQRPKAIIVTILLVAMVAAAVLAWRRWLSPRGQGRGPDAVFLLLGLLTSAASVLLMLMVMGNVQASLAPIAITLAYG